MKRLLITAAATLALTACAADVAETDTPAAEAPATALTIADGYVMAPLKGRDVAAGYFKVSNQGADRSIVSAQSSSAAAVELHTHTMTDGVMSMREVTAIEVPAGGDVELKPGSFHLMMFGFDHAEGQEAAAVTLTLDNGETIDLSLPIRERE